MSPEAGRPGEGGPVQGAALPGHAAFCDHLEPYLAKAWEDLTDPAGHLPYSHDCYLKAWELAGAYIPADFVLVDEAQDLSPVLISILAQQAHAQLVWVGDSQQELYGWRGCRNALASFAADARLYLTGSFRFGPPIAERANDVLANLDTPLALVGLGGPSWVGRVERPDAILCRSNAGAVVALMTALEDRREPMLLGGPGEVIAFCRGAQALQEGRHTEHSDLGCFSTWHDVQQYTTEDPQGDDLALMVRLVDRFGAWEIIEALDASERSQYHDLIITTTHKAKGKEWDTVRLYDDFTRAEMTPEEWRCLYVGVTRAKSGLDMGGNG